MKMNEFIRLNHKRIDREIKGKPAGSVPDNKERELWVRNDHDLSRSAKKCGFTL